MDRQRTDFRLVFFLLCLLLPASVATGTIDINRYEDWMIYGSYWILFVAVVALGLMLFMEAWESRYRLKGLFTAHRNGLIVVVFASIFLQVHEPHSFKMLPEEYSIASTARSMHLYREYSVVDVGYARASGVTRVSSRLSDAYPLYPWMLSVVHGLTGYRPENAFVLNGLLGLVACILVYGLVSSWMGAMYGKLSVLLLGGLPLFHDWVCGGGSGVLEVCLLLGMLWQIRVCLQRVCIRPRVVLIMIGFLLACSSPIGSFWSLFLYAAMRCMTDSGNVRSRVLWFSSIFWLYPAALWSMVAGPVSIHSLSSAIIRFGESAFFLFDTSRALGNSPFLSAVGLVSLVFLIVHLARDRKRKQEAVVYEWLMLGFVTIMGFSAVGSMFVVDHGWTDPREVGASIPFYLIALLLPSYIMRFGFMIAAFPKTLLLIPVIMAVMINGSWNSWGAPYRIKDSESIGMRYLEKALESTLEKKDALYIGVGHSGAIVRGWSAMPTSYANRIPERIELLMRIRYFRNVYVGEFVSDQLFSSESVMASSRFLMEPVFERAIKDSLVVRVSRIVGIADPVPGCESRENDLPQSFPEPGLSIRELVDYMNNLLLGPDLILPDNSEK